jgi:nitroreductase
MELGEAIRRRSMCRDFADRPVGNEVVDRLLDRARRAPSAGHSQGWAFLVLRGATETARFWQATADEAWLEAPDRPGLLRAPVVVVPLCSPQVYVQRYSEPDKARHGLTSEEAWPVPFWTVDVSFATMLLLLGAVEEGLGALFFGLFRGVDRLRAEFGVPGDWQPIGAVALGWRSAGEKPSGSGRRARKHLEEVVHRGGW